MGIISLTPRIDYSQGNKWDVTLDTMDDLHKPSLDEIGFREHVQGYKHVRYSDKRSIRHAKNNRA